MMDGWLQSFGELRIFSIDYIRYLASERDNLYLMGIKFYMKPGILPRQYGSRRGKGAMDMAI